MLRSLMRPMAKEFEFAGFSFPRYLATLPRGTIQQRLARARDPVCGPYYHAPKPNQADGVGFYLESDGGLQLRWRWCDEVRASIGHQGWYCDDTLDQTIRGLVLTLPKSRGFLAGWSMGEHMASSVDEYVYADEMSAACAADSMAERAAEEQRDFDREERARLQAAEEDDQDDQPWS